MPPQHRLHRRQPAYSTRTQPERKRTRRHQTPHSKGNSHSQPLVDRSRRRGRQPAAAPALPPTPAQWPAGTRCREVAVERRTTKITRVEPLSSASAWPRLAMACTRRRRLESRCCRSTWPASDAYAQGKWALLHQSILTAPVNGRCPRTQPHACRSTTRAAATAPNSLWATDWGSSLWTSRSRRKWWKTWACYWQTAWWRLSRATGSPRYSSWSWQP